MSLRESESRPRRIDSMRVRWLIEPRPVSAKGFEWLRKLWPTGVVVFLWLLVLMSGVGQIVLLRLAGRPLDTPPASLVDFVVALLAVVLASFGALVVLRGDSWRYGWLMMWMGTAIGIIGFTGLYSLYTWGSGGSVSLVAVWVNDLWMVSQMLGFLLLPALFPDGMTASPRWRVPLRLATVAWMALIILFVLSDRSATNVFLGVEDPPANPTGFLPIPMDVFNVSWAVLVLTSIAIGIGSLVTRWRRADLELRQRLKWMIYAFGLLLTLAGLNLVNTILRETGIDLGLSMLMELMGSAAFLGLAVALGFAVLRFRLYDVDPVINRTIVYGALTVCVVGIYIAVVVGAGALLPVQRSFLALVTTGIVAVAFAPLKTRLQGWVNRLMFGQRDDPYALLAEMGRVMTEAGTPEETLQTLTETVATSLKLPGVAIDLDQDGEWTRRATFGLADVETGGVVVPLRHQGELVGRLVVMPRSSRELPTTRDMGLLQDIAHPAGAIARSVRLTMALQSSRERLVMAQEEERRRIRRDLHDGLGPSLASQTFQLDEVLDRLQDDPAGAADLVMALKAQNQQLVADIRRLVYELRPPALDELGVAGALTAHVAQLERSGLLSIEVTTIPDPLPVLPAAVEVAAYRIAREAITNTVRHAGATHCATTLEATADKLIISVRDNGAGIGQGADSGVGLLSMRERSEELGGTFRALSSDLGGTEIVATLPLMNARQEDAKMSATNTYNAGAGRG